MPTIPYPPDADMLLAMSNGIAEQVRKYTDMQRAYHGSSGDFSSEQGQKLQEQAEVVARECGKLQALISEPKDWMVQAAWSYCDSVAISTVIEMGIPTLIKPDGKGVTLSYLASCTNASPALIKRIMRICLNRVDDGLLCGAYLARTACQAAFKISDNPTEAAFGIAFQTKLSLYEYYHSVDTERGRRFSRAMAGHYDGPLDMPIELIYPFDYLPNGSTLVDIGGGNGQNTIRLVVSYPQLSAVVQDHVSVISIAEKKVKQQYDEKIAGRITWEAHDYYAQQPQKGADIYLLSHVLMDNSDENCVKMIREIAQVMDPARSRLLIHDFVDLPRAVGDRPRLLDMLDIHMIASLNTYSRSEVEFDHLIGRAAGDRGLVRYKTWQGKGGSAVLELRLQSTSESAS
ncbi:sterigmatocystin 8-O-methyltransferase [Nannizzia gypsea CBS 118893]|uniref:Sterigmatocystin 8-O-methyltransferase n=1 Tax=Arthroderma gypseum (strain ATCC MYA-4604 / CBS 118893) TaxID=535722 RepID=E4UTK6_ARTGP|nr:sterigmatocystin 8-O-methyltransferase [Nannizzia gypsea CBS 118893]EFR00715.1 sterigmatocystin 8-O-methyltransferase [Nannizzia gypsea CBS 118893]